MTRTPRLQIGDTCGIYKIIDILPADPLAANSKLRYRCECMRCSAQVTKYPFEVRRETVCNHQGPRDRHDWLHEIGEVIGNWRITEKIKVKNQYRYKAVCTECGKERQFSEYHLSKIDPDSKCTHDSKYGIPTLQKDLRIGHIVITDVEKSDESKRAIYHWRCDCGATGKCRSTGIYGRIRRNGVENTVCNAENCACVRKSEFEIGQRLGDFLTIKDILTDSGTNTKIQYLVQCDCGREHIKSQHYLRTRVTSDAARTIRGCCKQCGLSAYGMHLQSGDKCGADNSLTFIKYIESDKKTRRCLVRCECGNEFEADVPSLHAISSCRMPDCSKCKPNSYIGRQGYSHGIHWMISDKADEKDRVVVLFEDGATKMLRNVKSPVHPLFSKNAYPSAREFHGYADLKYAFDLPDGTTYYNCIRPDGISDVMTIQQMLKTAGIEPAFEYQT